MSQDSLNRDNVNRDSSGRDSEQSRVQALLEAGRISEDEAEILFAALADSEAAQASERAAALPFTASGSEPLRTDPAPADVQPPQPLEPPPLPPAAAETQTGWVKLSGFCGDLVVTSDPDIGAPIVTGHATLERTETGYFIRTPPETGEGSRNWLARLHRAAGDVTVRLPTELGLDLAVAAGDGEIRGVRAVKGTFTGGDFKVSGAETVDLTVTAGDVTLKLRPRSGEGRLKATSGDIDVIFLPGTSAVVSGSATCGDLTVPPSFARSGGFASHRFEGTLGAGEARLELRLTAGDVNVRAEGA